MTIRTRLLLMMALLLGGVFCIGLIVFVATTKATVVVQKGIVANTLVQEVFNLNTLTSDYLLHHESRAVAQWYITAEVIDKLLRDQNFRSDSGAMLQRERIRQDLEESRSSFAQLTKSIEQRQLSSDEVSSSSALEKRLIGQIQIHTQSMVTAATQVSRSAVEEREMVRRWSDQLILFLIFAIAIAILIAFFLFYRIIVDPVFALASIARQVRQGNLSKRAIVTSQDEIGELTIAFNGMLDSLKESHENLENKVHERTQQLEMSNKELESFSYSVSHDLRAPLRAIDGFSQILEEDYSAKIDEKGKEVITTIRESTKRMALLIDDLLSFSRLGRAAMKLQDVMVKTMVMEVFADLQRNNSQRTIHFTCEELPVVYADGELLRQVWINLLSNAIKYTKYKEVTEIHIGYSEKKHEVIFFVKDNGAGFDMHYVGKLFGVFQRLHAQKDFDGTGVGLANVARIIIKHGGRVWAEGEVEKGATFYFSLPKKVANL